MTRSRAKNRSKYCDAANIFNAIAIATCYLGTKSIKFGVTEALAKVAVFNNKPPNHNMPDFSAAIALLRKPIEDVYVSSTGLVKEKLALIRTAGKMKALHKKLWESQRVKTIWQTERPLSLSTFFHPVSVIPEDGINAGTTSGTRLTSLDDLPDNHNIIFGTVGQGKSILVRYLLGREIRSGIRIPVLCELRNVDKQTLIEHLCERFSALLGAKPDIAMMLAFAEKGKISFLLDGFDEIDPSNVQKVLSEIEDLSYKYPTCRILLSSRPETECKNLPRFYSNRISPLKNDDLFAFYKKITKDDEFTKRLVGAVSSSPTKIRDLIKTPLLATLLAISYRTAHKIPLDFAEFYDDLFQILLVRHDGSKLGWRRQRKTKLNDREIQQTFEAFCFATRKRQTISLDRETAYNLATESIKECQLASDSQGFLDDVKNITCLLIEEGKKVNFVHASVQEFFAARYIRTRSQPVAENFYTQLQNGKWNQWTEEIQFLRQIDTHRATKFFLIPDIDNTVIDFLNPPGAVTTEAIHRYLNSISIKRTIVERDGAATEKYFIQNNQKTNTYHYSLINSRIFYHLFHSKAAGENDWTHGFALNESKTLRTYLEICNDKGASCYAKAAEIITILINSYVRDRIAMINTTKHNESPSSFMAL